MREGGLVQALVALDPAVLIVIEGTGQSMVPGTSWGNGTAPFIYPVPALVPLPPCFLIQEPSCGT